MDIKDAISELNTQYNLDLSISYSSRLKHYSYWDGAYIIINDKLEFTNEVKWISLHTSYLHCVKKSHWLTPYDIKTIEKATHNLTTEIDSVVVSKPKKQSNVCWGCGCVDGDFYAKKGLNPNLKCIVCGELVVRKDGD